MMADNINSLSDITKISEDIRSEVNKSIVGLTNHIDTLTLSLLTGGHVLLEGLPGTAKTFLRGAARQRDDRFTAFSRICRFCSPDFLN